MEARQNKWEREHRARIIVVTTPEERDRIRESAEAKGQSLNAYILQAVQDRMDKERQ